jgi:hypothetical protein
MTPVFTINFRREIYQREVARTRRRLFTLGGWLLYFGVLGLVIGLYGLNCTALTRRVRLLERQTTRFQQAQGAGQDWMVDDAQLAAVERFHTSPRRWRDRLVRLASLLPTNVVLASIAVNPDNLSTPLDQDRLLVTGELRALPGQDPLRGVMQLVSMLQRDSVFASGYQSIKLAQSRASAGSLPATEFVIECR